MNFKESEAYLFSLGNEVAAMKLGLENITRLLAGLGDPQTKYLKVQVAGTNGKGSVCAFLGAICNAAGIKTGVFTSPHLISITERIVIAGVDISESDFARRSTAIRRKAEFMVASGELEYTPTFFEQVTAIALVAFAEAAVDLAILETGLGGRLDATTAAKAEIAAITRIDVDHQEYLGETIEEIAGEKAAIIRVKTKAVVIGKQGPAAMKVLLERCAEVGLVPLTVCEPFESAFDTTKQSSVVEFTTNRHNYWDSSLGLAGRHQIENACTAVLIAEQLLEKFDLAVDEEAIWKGLEDARHPGRLEYSGKFLFDGAHNVAGAMALAEFLVEFETRPLTIIFGAMRDKNISGIVGILFPLAEKIVIAESKNVRSTSYEDILSAIPERLEKTATFVTDNAVQAIDIAEAVTPDDGIILVTGSLYLVGEVKRILKSQI